MFVNFTLKSANEKTGKIPVSTSSSDTCPSACPLKKTCYAKQFRLGAFWRKVDAGVGSNVSDFESFCEKVSNLPSGTFWRHNQAGDLPGTDNDIDSGMLDLLVKANKGKRGFTYTHKPTTFTNLVKIRKANAEGFTVNLSANSLEEVDSLLVYNLPVVTVLPAEYKGKKFAFTPNGQKVAVCPAINSDSITCASCQLCQKQNRKLPIGFPVHGAGSSNYTKEV